MPSKKPTGPTGQRTPLPFALPDIGVEELEAVRDVLTSGWITTGPWVQRLEREMEAYLRVPHAVALNSGTAAMHLALEAMGIARGDLVLTTPYTFAATAEVIRYFGAIPVFVDVAPDTLNMDPARLAEVITSLEERGLDSPALGPGGRTLAGALGIDPPSRLRAIMPVHIGGHPCALDEILTVAEERGLGVVEDAAHALPTKFRGELVGSGALMNPRLSDHAVCFSFYATKTLTTGEGGMLVTSSEEIADRARRMSLHGISKDAWKRYTGEGSWYYEVHDAGYKYNMTDIAGAMGVVQLAKLERMSERRAEIAQKYAEAFAGFPELEVPKVRLGCESSWHLFMLRLNLQMLSVDRAGFLDILKRKGIGASVHFIPLHIHPLYRDLLRWSPADFPVAFREYEREVSLPIYSRMENGDVDRVIEATVQAVEETRG